MGKTIVMLLAGVLIAGAAISAFMAIITTLGGAGLIICFLSLLFLLSISKYAEWRAEAYQRDLNRLEVEAKKVSIESQQVSVQSQLASVRRQLTVENVLQADANGLYPITVQALQLPEVQLANLQIAYRLQQSKDNVLQSLNYGPKYTNNQTNTGIEQPLLTADAPGFWQLVESGKLPDGKMLLGYDQGKEQVTASWNELRSTLIGGKSGTGKSTALRSLLAQAALQGSRFVVVDPHYNSGEESLGHSLQPLQSLMLADVAHDDATISQALSYVMGIGESRLAGRDKERFPVVLVVDEVTALLSRSNVADDLNRTLQFIATETRKVNVYTFCAGQNFNASIMPSETRNNFVSMFGFQMRRDTARAMSGNTEFAQQVESLSIGQMVWFAPSGDLVPVSVPNVTESDLNRVAQKFLPNTLGSSDFQPTSNQLPVTENASEIDAISVDRKLTGSQTEAKKNSVVDARIVQLFLEGKTITEIVREVFDVTGGRRFQECNQLVMDAIREKIR